MRPRNLGCDIQSETTSFARLLLTLEWFEEPSHGFFRYWLALIGDPNSDHAVATLDTDL